MEEDIQAAVSVTNAYWQTHWPQLFTGGYSPPRVAGAYDGDTPGTPVCGGAPLPDDNAVYCPDGDYIAWDMDLMRWGHARGDAWVYLVIAHEWAMPSRTGWTRGWWTWPVSSRPTAWPGRCSSAPRRTGRSPSRTATPRNWRTH
ncbi:hypothetical protein SVIO_080690 [Streptomyces violaceusniger]|uniref:Uncharacterized protein n=1 Tax=Streptomyces violaceusniger TaxID=68280 RepID=A0A4D4LDZ3_STRVO|nr:hypothetical protein SVIO_080690 [Streptomyces violaceusniger]